MTQFKDKAKKQQQLQAQALKQQKLKDAAAAASAAAAGAGGSSGGEKTDSNSSSSSNNSMLGFTGSPNLGLLSYPVLMAADILLYKATHVPGEAGAKARRRIQRNGTETLGCLM